MNRRLKSGCFAHRTAPNDARQLRAILDDLYQQGELPLYRGKVSRITLKELVAIPNDAIRSSSKNAKWKWARNVLDTYDRYLRDIEGRGIVWEERVPIIKKHLDQLHAARQLPVNSTGRLNQKVVLDSLNFPSSCFLNVLRRAPRLKALFAKYDKIISKHEYSQYRSSALEGRLAELLKRDDIKIVFGRRVNLVWLHENLGLSNSHALFQTPALKALIDQKNVEIKKRTARGTTSRKVRIRGVDHINLGAAPYSEKHGRIFSFDEFTVSLGLRFIERLGTAFHHSVQQVVEARGIYYKLRNFLRWLVEHEQQFAEIISSLRNCRTQDAVQFERMALRYQQDVIANPANRTGLNNRQPKLQLKIIETLGECGIFPLIKIPNIKRSRPGRRGARPSMVEAGNVSDATHTILEIHRDAAIYRNIHFEPNNETVAFANALAMERRRRTDLPDSLPEAIKVLCEERLSDVRAVAASAYTRWSSAYFEGRRLIEEALHSPAEIMEALNAALASSKLRALGAVSSKYFPKADRDASLRNVLALIDGSFSCVCPHTHNDKWGQFWSHVYSNIGGCGFVQQHLAPTCEAVVAGFTLYLAESGANMAVAINCESNALRPSEVPNHTHIASIKKRAAYKPIIYDLPNEHYDGKLSAVAALKLIRDATKPLRNHESAKWDRIALYPRSGTVHTIEEWQVRDYFKKIVSKSETLREFKLVPSMIRPTVLLAVQLSNPGDLSAAQRIAQHESDTTTFGYVNKLPYRIILEEKIRKFSTTIEVVLSHNLTDAATKLALTPDNWEDVKKHARATGLGVFCSNSLAGAQADYPRGTSCLAVDRCLACQMIVVVAEPHAIADMMIWQKALNIAADQWLEERYARWTEVWVPWQAFFQVVLEEKMARGELLAVKVEAKEIVEKLMQSPEFQLPEPW